LPTKFIATISKTIPSRFDIKINEKYIEGRVQNEGVIIPQGELYEQALKAETNGHETYKPQQKCKEN
jgi:hypothetical protein